MSDVLITPASKKIEFKDGSSNIDGTIKLDANDNLVLTSANDLVLGDGSTDLHIGDGTNSIDMVFDQAGRIYGAANKDITIGKSSVGGNDIIVDSPNWVVTAAGYVGLGTTAPATKLHIERSESDSENLMLRLRDSTVNATGERIGIEGYWNTVPAGDIEFELTNTSSGASAIVFSPHSTGGTKDEAMRIASDGNVGIGTTSPSDKLHLLGSDGGTSILVEDSGTNSNPAVEIKNDAVHWKLQARGGSSDNFQIGEGSNTHVVVDTSGNVGIGTTSPDKLLHVVGAANDETVALFSTAGATSGSVQGKVHIGLSHFSSDANPSVSFTAEEIDVSDYRADLVFNTRSATSDAAPAERMRITHDGDVGIGTGATIDAKLHVEGSVLIDAYGVGDGAGLFFRDGFQNTNQPSITVHDHSGANPDGLAISAYDGISFNINAVEVALISGDGGSILKRAQIVVKTGLTNAISGITDAGRVILLGTGSDACTVQLQASPEIGEQYVFVQQTSGPVKIQANGSDTINGSTADVVMAGQWKALTVIALSAAKWIAIGA